jgi:hypothetical protein
MPPAAGAQLGDSSPLYLVLWMNTKNFSFCIGGSSIMFYSKKRTLLIEEAEER